MEKETKKLSRKKFLTWGFSIGSVLAVPAIFKFSKKKREVTTAKMLTRDGQLVEVDVSHISPKKRKIKPEEIHTWIRSRKS